MRIASSVADRLGSCASPVPETISSGGCAEHVDREIFGAQLPVGDTLAAGRGAAGIGRRPDLGEGECGPQRRVDAHPHRVDALALSVARMNRPCPSVTDGRDARLCELPAEPRHADVFRQTRQGIARTSAPTPAVSPTGVDRNRRGAGPSRWPSGHDFARDLSSHEAALDGSAAPVKPARGVAHHDRVESSRSGQLAKAGQGHARDKADPVRI